MTTVRLLLIAGVLVAALCLYFHLERQENRILELGNELATSIRDRKALAEQVEAAKVAEETVSQWAGWNYEVLTTAPDVVTVIERVEIHAPLRLDDRVDDAVFLPLCVRVYETDRACFYQAPGTCTADAGPGFDPVAWCKGETRPTWRGLVQWIARLVDRVALERGDDYSLREWDAKVGGE